MQSWPHLLNLLKNQNQSLSYSLTLKVYMRLLSGLTYIAVDTLFGILSIFLIAFNVTSILGFIHS